MFYKSNVLTLVESWPAEHELLASAFKRAFAIVTDAAEASNHVYWSPKFTASSLAAFNELGAVTLDHMRALGSEGPAEVSRLPGFFLAFDDTSSDAQLMVKALHILLSTPSAREGWLEQLASPAFTSDGLLLSTPTADFAFTWAKRVNRANLRLLWGAVKAEVEAFVVPEGMNPSETRWDPGVFNLSHPRVRSMLARMAFIQKCDDQTMFDELSFFDPFPRLDHESDFFNYNFSPNALARYFRASNFEAFETECAKRGIDDALVMALVPGWLGSAAEFFVAAQTLTADAS